MIFCESLIKNKKATQCAGLHKTDSVFRKSKGMRAFRPHSFFQISCLARDCILSSVSYQIKEKKFSHDFIIVVHSQNFGVFTDFLKKKLFSGRFPLFSHHAKNKRHTVNNTLKPKLSASYTELCSFKG